jgi:hypothetical protein
MWHRATYLDDMMNLQRQVEGLKKLQKLHFRHYVSVALVLSGSSVDAKPTRVQKRTPLRPADFNHAINYTSGLCNLSREEGRRQELSTRSSNQGLATTSQRDSRHLKDDVNITFQRTFLSGVRISDKETEGKARWEYSYVNSLCTRPDLDVSGV